MNISIQITGLDKLVRNFTSAGKIIDEELNKAMDQSLLQIEREVKLRTPVDTGRLRGSIGGGEGWRWIRQRMASIGTRVNYATIVETKPAQHAVGEVGYFKKGVIASINKIHDFFKSALQRVAVRLTK